MFGIDFSEIGLIFLIALVVLGPAKLPQVAATIGRWIGRARTMARQFREQLEQEANTLKQAADLRQSPSPVPPAAPPPAAKPEPAPHTDGTAQADGSAPADGTAPAESTPQMESELPQMDSNLRFATAAASESQPMGQAAPGAHAELAPEHLDHPAPLPAEPHERGA